ncbi:MAG TPA: hypothetical protein DCR14_14485 [Acidimicrobiaceae bacterium]|nr:hypothetical protein [Acidimicrobiaceae bacterium]
MALRSYLRAAALAALVACGDGASTGTAAELLVAPGQPLASAVPLQFGWPEGCSVPVLYEEDYNGFETVLQVTLTFDGSSVSFDGLRNERLNGGALQQAELEWAMADLLVDGGLVTAFTVDEAIRAEAEQTPGRAYGDLWAEVEARTRAGWWTALVEEWIRLGETPADAEKLANGLVRISLVEEMSLEDAQSGFGTEDATGGTLTTTVVVEPDRVFASVAQVVEEVTTPDGTVIFSQRWTPLWEASTGCGYP